MQPRLRMRRPGPPGSSHRAARMARSPPPGGWGASWTLQLLLLQEAQVEPELGGPPPGAPPRDSGK